MATGAQLRTPLASPGAPTSPRVPSPAESALLRAVDLGVVAVTAAGAVAAAVALLVASSPIGAGIAAGSVLATVFAWVTRFSMVRASAGPAEAIGVWILVSYAIKFVLLLVALTLGSRDHDIDRTAYGLTLVTGVIVSVALQALMWNPRRTQTVVATATPADSAYDDDQAVAAARAGHATSRAGAPAPAGGVRPNGSAAGKVPPR